MRSLDVRLALRSAAALYAASAVLFSVAALVEDADVQPELLGLAGLALAGAVALLLIDRAGRGSMGLVFAAELLAVAAGGAVVALTNGAHSSYAAFLALPLLHAAVFQSRGRFITVMVLSVGGFLAPFAYDSGEARWFAGVAIPALVPTLVIVWVVHLVVATLRHERRALSVREAEAMRIAESDELTGIGNYRRFWRALQAEAARARRHDLPFSLIVLDLDGFKAINDELGHQAGDWALQRVARALEGELRTEDVLCRQGGDEFAVIAVAAGLPEARELARRLEDAVGQTAGRGLARPLSASAGFATFGDPEWSAEGLLARADQALREAKRRGRDGTPQDGGPPAEQAPAPDQRLAALRACSRDLALADDELGVLQAAVAHVAEALEAAVVELWRHDPDSGRPVVVARGRHTGAPEVSDNPVPAAEVEAVMARNHVVTLADGCLLLPVSHAGHVEGVLSVRGGRTGLEERRLALTMAAQAGRALAAAAARERLDSDGTAELERLAAAAGAGPNGERVAELAEATGRELGLSVTDLQTLCLAARLHKVGMLGIPAGLPLRPAALSREEQDVVREHPVIAERLLSPIPRLGDAAVVLRHAHERYDGKGYPDGLAGQEIPPASRVLHAAIAYSAMRATRPWRPALSYDEARDELRHAAGSQLHPDVVEALLRALDGQPVA